MPRLQAITDRDPQVVHPSGDTSGVTDRQNLTAAIAALAAVDGGTVVLSAGRFYIDGTRVVIPNSVNLWGQGNGEQSASTIIECTAAGGGIDFGVRTEGHRGGVSGNFTVDGADVATRPLVVGLAVERTFIGMESTRSAGDGLILESTQNCAFVSCCVSHTAGVSLALDYSAAGNRFFQLELDSAATWFIHYRRTGAPGPGIADTGPFDNHIYGGIFERIATSGAVWHEKGDLNGITDAQLVNDVPDHDFVFVKQEQGIFTITGGLLQTNSYTAYGTAFYVTNSVLVLNGTITVNNVATIFESYAQVLVNGQLRPINYTTWATVNDPTEYIVYPMATLGTVPVLTAGNQVLSTSLAPVNDTWWSLDPDKYPTVPDGRRLQYRLRAIGLDIAAGDHLAVMLYDPVGLAGLTAEIVATADANGFAEADSGWIPFPATAKHGFLMARNQDAAAGSIVEAHVEVRIA